MSSIFSKIITKEIPSYEIMDNSDFIAILDINPIVRGHTLIIPHKEMDYIFDMNDEELCKMMMFAKHVANAIKKVVPCKKVGVSVIGLEIPHVHIHLIPITNESDMSFLKPRKHYSPAEMEATASAIASVL